MAPFGAGNKKLNNTVLSLVTERCGEEMMGQLRSAGEARGWKEARMQTVAKRPGEGVALCRRRVLKDTNCSTEHSVLHLIENLLNLNSLPTGMC